MTGTSPSTRRRRQPHRTWRCAAAVLLVVGLAVPAACGKGAGPDDADEASPAPSAAIGGAATEDTEDTADTEDTDAAEEWDVAEPIVYASAKVAFGDGAAAAGTALVVDFVKSWAFNEELVRATTRAERRETEASVRSIARHMTPELRKKWNGYVDHRLHGSNGDAFDEMMYVTSWDVYVDGVFFPADGPAFSDRQITAVEARDYGYGYLQVDVDEFAHLNIAFERRHRLENHEARFIRKVTFFLERDGQRWLIWGWRGRAIPHGKHDYSGWLLYTPEKWSMR